MVHIGRALRRGLRKVVRRITFDAEEARANARQQTIIHKAAWFLAGNQIRGDYLEFGVFRGASFIEAFFTIQNVFRVAASTELIRLGHHTEDDCRDISEIWRGMRFFAFDSFAGLPKLADGERGLGPFVDGKFACSEADFLANVARAGIPMGRVFPVAGWFSDSCTADTVRRLGLRRAAIVHIDCDLYASTASVLAFVTPLLQAGTVIIFDDWYHFRADPRHGEQRAFREWANALEEWSFVEYQKEGAFRISFVATPRWRPTISDAR